jgi:hypothetical protein
LNSLTVEDNSNSLELPDDDAFDSYVIRAETLRVLFSFTNLTTIVLKPIRGFDLDDEVVLDMARAWRRVEELRLAPAEKRSASEPTCGLRWWGSRRLPPTVCTSAN